MTALADINMLKAILWNLISNAIKYSHWGVVTFSFSAEYKDISIKDEHQESFFDSDKQFSTYRTEKEKGTGLGLPGLPGFYFQTLRQYVV